MIPTLYILCGPSGSGKSTWAIHFMNSDPEEKTRYVSRDEIRYSMIAEDDNYFAREREVFRKFANTIRQTLVDGFDVIADATHLNEFSRRKLTQAIDMYFKNYNIVYIVFKVDINECLKRNEGREGRAKVPETVIRNMCRDFRPPVPNEDTRATAIKYVGE